METTEIVEYGVRYQNGEEDWDTRRWFGHIETPEMRASFTEQYDLRMAGFGVPRLPLVFLTRTKTTSYSQSAVIDDPAPEQVPDPEPVPGEELAPDPEPATEDPAPEQSAAGNETMKEGATHGAE